ncbi:putative cytokinetic ring protein SteA [soil metagenome]
MARAAGPTAGAGVRTGRARVDRRTKELIKRLQPGDVAVIDHRDLDRVAADGLVEGGAVAVVNAAVSISGRYPNGGPIRVVRAGIPLLDAVGSDLLQRVSEGDTVEVDGEVVRVRGEVVGEGRVLTEAAITDAMEDARSRIGVELERFAANTLQYVKEEARLTFEPLELPPLKTRFQGRHVLVVVRGHDYREDLRHLRAYVSEHRPVLIGVDGGADALLETGLRPDIILGDFDSVSERAVETGAELVHHVHPDGRAPGRDALLELGVRYQEFVVEGTSEDAAMLLAYEAGARLIVAVGTHATMVEFRDKCRAGMSSTCLTRLRLGPALVDAKGVSQLYEGRVRSGDMALLIGAAVAAMLVVILASDPLQTFVEALWLYVRDLWRSLTS